LFLPLYPCRPCGGAPSRPYGFILSAFFFFFFQWGVRTLPLFPRYLNQIPDLALHHHRPLFFFLPSNFLVGLRYCLCFLLAFLLANAILSCQELAFFFFFFFLFFSTKKSSNFSPLVCVYGACLQPARPLLSDQSCVGPLVFFSPFCDPDQDFTYRFLFSTSFPAYSC